MSQLKKSSLLALLLAGLPFGLLGVGQVLAGIPFQEGAAPAFLQAVPDQDQRQVQESLRFAGNAEITLDALLVKPHWEALDRLPNPAGLELIAPGVRELGIPLSGGKFSIALESNLVANVIVDRIEQNLPGATGYIGHLEGLPDTFVAISIGSDNMHGIVDSTVDRYEIEPVNTSAGYRSDFYIVRRLDLNTLARRGAEAELVEENKGSSGKVLIDKAGAWKAGSRSADESEVGVKSHTSGHVGVMVLYTHRTAAERDMVLFVNNLISSTNESFSTTTDVAGSVYLAHAEEITYDEGTSVTQDRDRMAADGDGHLDFIDDMEAAWGADLTILIGDDDRYFSDGGRAFIYDQTRPYAAVADGWAAGDWTFPHEIGHILGGFHDWEALDPDGDGQPNATNPHFTTGYGYLSDDNSWHTMMGVCNTAMCAGRQLFWSNPDDDRTFNGERTGDDTNDPVVSDMRTALNGSMPNASNWRVNPAPPSRPSVLDVQPQFCFGSNLVEWSASSGVVGSYELYKSSSSNFSSQTLVYKGTDLATSITISSSESPQYLRIRACNGGGCSSYRNGDQTATYTNGCL